MSPSKILLFLCLSFIVGIFLESIVKIPQVFIWGFLICAILFIFSSFFVKNINFAVGFYILFLVLGILRMQISEFTVANDKLSKFNGKGEVVLSGVIINEPDVRDASQKLKIKAEGSLILVTTQKYPEYKYLDKVKLTGKLEAPFETEEFSYKNYLMKDMIYSVMGFPKIEVLGKARASFFNNIYSAILAFKQKIRKSIDHNFLPPQSSILKGTILGDNGSISADFKNKLNITGLRHIIAVSGTHIVILSSILMSILLFLGFWRGQAFYIAIILIFFYIILVGLPASGIRAGIMGAIYLLGQKIGRQSSGSRIIFLAAALMLMINPLLLFYDIGFQLSFLAVLGLIFFDPLIKNFFKFLIKKSFGIEIKEKAENILSMITVTFSAQIFTLPVIIYNFGNISFFSPLTNILILPIVPYLMIFGFLSAFAGVFWGVLGWMLSVPCYFLLSYFIWIIDFFSKPWAYKIIKNVHWIWLALSYLIIGFANWFLNKKTAARI